MKVCIAVISWLKKACKKIEFVITNYDETRALLI